MADNDVGSVVVMAHGEVVGTLTFREVILSIVKGGGEVGGTLMRNAMNDRSRRNAPHDGGLPCAIHAGDEPE
jgi:hypothetical protein